LINKKIILSTLLASTLLVATEVDLKKDDKLVTHTELGYIQTDGNTKTKTFNLDAKVKKGWGKHILDLHLDGQYASDKDTETKNKYIVELVYDYEFTDRFSLNYLNGYKSDKFSSFNYQAYTGPGAKYKLIVSPNHNLSLDGNILYSVDDIADVEYDSNGDIIEYPNANNTPVATVAEGENDSYAGYRVKGVYAWQMLENLKFDQEVSYRGSFKDSKKYFVFSKTAFSSKISDIFSAGISYKVDYVNEPGDKEKSDTTLTLNLIVDY